MTPTKSATRVVNGDIGAAEQALLAKAEQIAWDIETTGLEWKTDRIATCQLFSPTTGTILVRTNGERPARLASLLSNGSVEKIFHFAMFDLRFMAHQWKAMPRKIACTKVASKILARGQQQDHSLKGLLEKHLGVRIDKAQRLSDWLANSLTREQVEYAANDVIHLPNLLKALQKHLRQHGLAALAEACFKHIPARLELELGGFGDVFTY